MKGNGTEVITHLDFADTARVASLSQSIGLLLVSPRRLLYLWNGMGPLIAQGMVRVLRLLLQDIVQILDLGIDVLWVL